MMTEYDSVDELLEDYRRQDRPITTIVRKRRTNTKHAARSVAECVLEEGYATIPGDYVEDEKDIFIDQFRDLWDKIEDVDVEWNIARTVAEHVEHPHIDRNWVHYGDFFDDMMLAGADIVVDLGQLDRWYSVRIPDTPANHITFRPIEPPAEWDKLKDVVWRDN